MKNYFAFFVTGLLLAFSSGRAQQNSMINPELLTRQWAANGYLIPEPSQRNTAYIISGGRLPCRPNRLRSWCM